MTTALIERIINVPITYDFDATALTEKVQQYAELTIAGVDDKAGYKIVHEARMDLNRARNGIEKSRKALKADVLDYGRKVDTVAKELTALIEPTERRLLAEEERIDAEIERIKREAEAARQKKIQDRVDAVVALGVPFEIVKVQSLADPEYAEYFDQLWQQSVLAAERKAEEDRLRREEQKRLKAEREELERQRREQEQERVRLDAERRQKEAEELAKEQAARAALRERTEAVEMAADALAKWSGEMGEAIVKSSPLTLPDVTANSVPVYGAVDLPVVPQEWRSVRHLAEDAKLAADRALELMAGYRPSLRKAFILSIIEALRVKADELNKEAGSGT